MTSPFQEKITKVYNALTNKINSSISTHNSSSSSHQDLRNSKISYGQVDSTSTSTVFTATVPNLNELVDGTTVMLRNGYVTSAEGFTLEINGLGAKPVYSNLANATRDTTIFNINYTMLFVYDSTRVDGGCWICYRGYDSNTNTVGYQIRTNSTPFTATDKGYKYRLWLETDGNKYMPVNTSTSTNATANRSSAMNTREFWIGGKILYNATNGTTNANATMSATTLWQQYTLTLGYSFNNTGSALTLTPNEPLYMVAKAKGNGKAQLNTPYYTQTLPSTEDGLIYIYLGHMYSATALELALDHPVYEYKNGHIRLYQETHTHTKSEITDFPSIPSKTSDLTNDSHFISTSSTTGLIKNDGSIDTNTYLTTHQDISGKEDNNNKVTSWSNTTTDTHYPSEKLVKDSLDGKSDTNHTHSGYASSTHSHGNISNSGIMISKDSVSNKNVVTDSTGKIIVEDKPSIPSKTSDITNDGADGSDTYAEIGDVSTAITTHDSSMYSHQDIRTSLNQKEVTSNKVSSITSYTGSTTKYPNVQAIEDYAEPKKSPLAISQLNSLISSASNNGTIVLDNDYVNGTSNQNIYITDKNITIFGNGHTIDSNNKLVSFILSNATVTIYDCNFINNTSTSILHSLFEVATATGSGTLSLNNCTFKNSSIKYYLMNIEGGTLNIRDCFFYNNAQTGSRYILYITNSNLDIQNTIFENNTLKPVSITNTNATSRSQVITECIFNNNVSAITESSSSGSYKQVVLKNNYFVQAGDTVTGCTNNNYLTQHQDISGKENSANKVTSWTATVTDTNYPSEKLVKDSLDTKQEHLSLLSAEIDEYGNSIFTDDGSYFYSTNDRIYHDWGGTDELHFIDSNGNDINFDDISLNGHPHNISNIVNLQTTLNNKANTNHTHVKEDIDFQTTTSSFNIHLYETTEYMVNRNEFVIPNGEKAIFDFALILLNDGDYVSFKITKSGGGSYTIYSSDGAYSYSIGDNPSIKIINDNGIIYTEFYTENGSLQARRENSVGIKIRNFGTSDLTGYFSSKTYSRKASWLDMIYPIGSIYISTQNRNPSLYFGGEWEQIEDRFLLASGSTYEIGTTGGEETHTLTVGEMPSHNHTQNQHRHQLLSQQFSTGTGNASAVVNSSNRTATSRYTDYQTPTINNTGGGQAHNNMPPYLAVSVWERIV